MLPSTDQKLTMHVSEHSSVTFTSTTVHTQLHQSAPSTESESPMSSDPAVIQSYDHSGDTTVSSENFENEVAAERVSLDKPGLAQEPSSFDTQAQLEDKHRLMSSSYEDIYVGTSLPGDEGLVSVDDVVPGEVGDRFDTRHVDPHLVKMPDGKSSSFENLYEEATVKESKDIEEKDVDEREKESDYDLDKPEKGEYEDEKAETEVEKSDSETVHSAPIDSSSDQLPGTRSPPAHLPSDLSPIDVTLESGLDRIGQTFAESQDRDSLERSKSYEAGTDEAAADGEDSLRQRHFSSPDDVLQTGASPEAMSPTGEDKGTHPRPLSMPWQIFCWLHSLNLTPKSLIIVSTLQTSTPCLVSSHKLSLFSVLPAWLTCCVTLVTNECVHVHLF